MYSKYPFSNKDLNIKYINIEYGNIFSLISLDLIIFLRIFIVITIFTIM